MLKTKIQKIRFIHLQQAFWLTFVIGLSWALITVRTNNNEVGSQLSASSATSHTAKNTR